MKIIQEEWEKWLPSIIIGFVGGITLFIVKIALNKFIFKTRGLAVFETAITALIFAAVFTIVSYQWDKKEKLRSRLKFKFAKIAPRLKTQ